MNSQNTMKRQDKGLVNGEGSKNRVVAVVAARMSSSRLPGKVLMPIGGKAMLGWVLERVQLANTVDDIVVATTTEAEDEQIAKWVRRKGFKVFRGSKDDVLGRFMAAAHDLDAGIVVRVNGDNPLVDPEYIDELITDAFNSGVDYESYQLRNGLPVMLSGLSFFTEIITRTCLEQACAIVTDKFEREHVTLGIYKRPSTFCLRFLEVPEFCDKPYLRFTLDTQADLDLLRHVFRALGDKAKVVGADEVVQLVEKHPEWKNIMSKQNALNPKFSET